MPVLPKIKEESGWKNTDIKIENPIAAIFRKHNIVEYKSPDDELNINDLYKVIGYAGLYKGTSTSSDQVDAKELTISLFRYRKPRELFKDLNELGAKIVQYAPGVYYVEGIINLPLQIVVIRELEREKHSPLKILTNNAEEDEVKAFLRHIREFAIREDKINAEALLQVSVSANSKLYTKIRRENIMSDALRELMKDVIDEEINLEHEKQQAIIDAKDTIIGEKDAEIETLKREIEKLKKVANVE